MILQADGFFCSMWLVLCDANIFCGTPNRGIVLYKYTIVNNSKKDYGIINSKRRYYSV